MTDDLAGTTNSALQSAQELLNELLDTPIRDYIAARNKLDPLRNIISQIGGKNAEESQKCIELMGTGFSQFYQGVTALQQSLTESAGHAGQV